MTFLVTAHYTDSRLTIPVHAQFERLSDAQEAALDSIEAGAYRVRIIDRTQPQPYGIVSDTDQPSDGDPVRCADCGAVGMSCESFFVINLGTLCPACHATYQG